MRTDCDSILFLVNQGSNQNQRNHFISVLFVVVVLAVMGFIKVRNSSSSSCFKRTLPGDMRHGDNISLPDSVIETSKPVKLKDFAEHYRIMSADSDFRFSEEYEELKHVGREKPCTAADMPVNRPKNRFTNILPYDHSRVKLQPADDEEGSDYINANFVPGFNSPREFIVTQVCIIPRPTKLWVGYITFVQSFHFAF